VYIRSTTRLAASLCSLLLLLWSFVVLILYHKDDVQYRSSRSMIILQQEKTAWNNQHNVVHVIQTRFMQFQPHLLELGWARLRLFQAITFPSVTHQTQSEFLWIIRTDPDLEPALRQELVDTVATFRNIILVGSNKNPEGFRGDNCMPEPKDVWSGSLAKLHSYWMAAQSHTLLETRLDADDALLLDYFDLVQTDATARLLSTTDSWVVWCADQHMEWQYENPWNTNHNHTTAHGSLLGLRAQHCVTAGLTWGYAVGTGPHQTAPVRRHQEIHQVVPRCPDENNNSKSVQCLVRVEPPNKLPVALRARTPTSAGMEHLVGSDKENAWQHQLRHSKWKSSQDELFAALPVLFGMEAQDLWNVRVYLEEHLPAIVEDAISGQCTKGHSCKDAAKKVLENMRQESSSTATSYSSEGYSTQ
jgi:hypothetical protein